MGLINVFVLYFLYLITYTAASLWCQQGGAKREFSPTQCEDDTAECFKLVCIGGQSPFTARGCGVIDSRTAKGLQNESCFQAMGVCQHLDGNPVCLTCRDKHLCNLSSTTKISILWIVLFLLVALV